MPHDLVEGGEMAHRVPVWRKSETFWQQFKRGWLYSNLRKHLSILGVVIVSVSLLQKHSIDESANNIKERAKDGWQRVMQSQIEDEFSQLRNAIGVLAMKIGPQPVKSRLGIRASSLELISLSLERMRKLNNQYSDLMTQYGVGYGHTSELSKSTDQEIQNAYDLLETETKDEKLFTEVAVMNLNRVISKIDASLLDVRNELAIEFDRKIERVNRFGEKIQFFFEGMMVLGLSLTWMGKEPREVDEQLQE
jgi:hypothetical protein